MKSGVIDQYMYAAKFEFGFFKKVRTGIHVRYVHGDGLDPRFLPQLFGDAFEVFPAARYEHKISPRIRKSVSGRRTNPLGSACDDDGFFFEVIVHWISLDQGHCSEKIQKRLPIRPRCTEPGVDRSKLIFSAAKKKTSFEAQFAQSACFDQRTLIVDAD